MTHDVTLPIYVKPSFSPRCVVCECENPTAIADITVLVSAPVQGLAEDAVDLALDTHSPSGNRNISLQVPACPRCKKGLKRWHFWKLIVQYLGPLLGTALLILALIKGLTYLGIGIVIVGIASPVIYELVNPPAFNATGSGRKLIYEFRSQRCSQEFAQLNQKEENSGS
ncbi:hypothetical protein V2H45_24210 [Tumidithrix elongata RA019]|uniref:Uncharacterized protein n=1 Tax=Tumidithrix elongata BACA0141 TaxID=2716417 RepID=A0AAW9Q7C0_9CYAN|nr:hypothetical protein [Tumidithrix elongata RA019]